MPKDLIIQVNGKPCLISYTVTGRRYDITIHDKEIKAIMPDPFFFIERDGRAMILFSSAEMKPIAFQIANEIINDSLND